MQQRGNENSIPALIIEREVKEFYKRYGLEECTIQGRFTEPPIDSEMDVFQWYVSTFLDLHSKICSGANAEDYVGVTLHSEKLFPHGDLWLSFRLVRDFSVDDLWKIFYNAAQSNSGFSMEDSFSVKCVVIEMISGGGGTRFKMTSPNVKKRSILTIRDDDMLCLPRSLVCAFVYAIRGQICSGKLHVTRNKVRQLKSTLQNCLVNKLL